MINIGKIGEVVSGVIGKFKDKGKELDIEKIKLEVERELENNRSEIFKAEVEDANSARVLHSQRLKSKDRFIKYWVPSLAICYNLLFFGLVYFLLMFELPEANQVYISMVIGAIISNQDRIMGFVFGNKMIKSKKK